MPSQNHVTICVKKKSRFVLTKLTWSRGAPPNCLRAGARRQLPPLPPVVTPLLPQRGLGRSPSRQRFSCICSCILSCKCDFIFIFYLEHLTVLIDNCKHFLQDLGCGEISSDSHAFSRVPLIETLNRFSKYSDLEHAYYGPR